MWDNNRNATIYELNDASMIRASTRIFIVDHAAGLHLDWQVLESSPCLASLFRPQQEDAKFITCHTCIVSVCKGLIILCGAIQGRASQRLYLI